MRVCMYVCMYVCIKRNDPLPPSFGTVLANFPLIHLQT